MKAASVEWCEPQHLNNQRQQDCVNLLVGVLGLGHEPENEWASQVQGEEIRVERLSRGYCQAKESC